jgi:hypothetical protein
MAAQAERAEQEGRQSLQASRQGWLVRQGIAGRTQQVGRQGICEMEKSDQIRQEGRQDR